MAVRLWNAVCGACAGLVGSPLLYAPSAAAPRALQVQLVSDAGWRLGLPYGQRPDLRDHHIKVRRDLAADPFYRGKAQARGQLLYLEAEPVLYAPDGELRTDAYTQQYLIATMSAVEQYYPGAAAVTCYHTPEAPHWQWFDGRADEVRRQNDLLLPLHSRSRALAPDWYIKHSPEWFRRQDPAMTDAEVDDIVRKVAEHNADELLRVEAGTGEPRLKVPFLTDLCHDDGAFTVPVLPRHLRINLEVMESRGIHDAAFWALAATPERAAQVNALLARMQPAAAA
jgi:hypothetical protein